MKIKMPPRVAQLGRGRGKCRGDGVRDPPRDELRALRRKIDTL